MACGKEGTTDIEPGTNPVNYNVGMLGHVDSGKTSLAKVLSTISSTAAFDKNPQSQERGITLDLGFSCFLSDVDFDGSGRTRRVQYTLVDCPGHASLIRTIIGGAQIVDLVVLVVDVTKGVQTQTAECLVIGEIVCPRLIVALNKVDQLEDSKRGQVVDKMKRRLQSTLEKTAYQAFEIVAVAANPEGQPIGVDSLLSCIHRMTRLPEPAQPGGHGDPFVFCVDHCFNIRGQGTVMTGTVLQGTIRTGENVEVASLRETRKVKSMQMFRRQVTSASRGDRVGLCVVQFDAKELERGLVSGNGLALPALHGGVMRLRRIPYFKGEVATGSKFHVSLGHETVLAKLTLFTSEEDSAGKEFDEEARYAFLGRVSELGEEEASSKGAAAKTRPVFAILEFERPVIVVPGCKVLGSRLDTDVKTTSCRLAFHGQLSLSFRDKDFATTELPKLKIFKPKGKEGVVERASADGGEVICKGMFKKETNLNLFSGLRVALSTGEEGVIGEPFGQSGKFKVRISGGLKPETAALLGTKKKKGGGGGSTNDDPVKLSLAFKKHVFSKKIVQ